LPPVNPGGGFVAELPVIWGLPGDDEEAAAWSMTAGYRAGRYLAVEASYVSLGTLDATQPYRVAAVLGGGADVDGLSLAVVYQL
jgi:hypothetical protein